MQTPLALHVGTLTDYFLAALMRDAASTSDPASPPVPSRIDVEARVVEWRGFVSRGLVEHGHMATQLDWPEQRQPTWTVGVPADALRALKLLLVHDQGDVSANGPPPPTELPEQPEKHPAVDRGSGIWLRGAPPAERSGARVLAAG